MYALASRYGSKVVAEGIRNLEAAAQAGKLTVAPSINHLAAAIDRSCSTATAIKTLPETLGKFAVNNTIHLPSCTTWLDVSSTIKNFAGAVDSAKLTKLTPNKVELVAQNDHGRWIIRAAPHPFDYSKRPGIKPAPGLAPTDKYIVQAELQQFDSRKNKFITVRHGHMEVQHNLGFEDFAQDMVDTFGVPKAKMKPYVPSGSETALIEIKKGSGESHQPIFVDNIDVSEAILARVAAAAAELAPAVPVAELEAAVEQVVGDVATAAKEASDRIFLESVLIDPNKIKFSQSSVNDVKKIIDSMRHNGWLGDPIDVVEMVNNELITIDNSRVLAARYAQINVKAIIHKANDLLPEDMAQTRFVSKAGNIPKTWGEAIVNRLEGQSASFRKTYPQGTDITGWDGN